MPSIGRRLSLQPSLPSHAYGPGLTQHSTTFHPTSRMGFHPPLPVVSPPYGLFCSSSLTNVQPTKPAPPQPSPARPDPYYGHENTARLYAQFITHRFACPEYSPTSSGSNTNLPYFIAYALHRTKLHGSVTFTALVLLQCLKARFPTAHGSSDHHLFISAFTIASKVICDDTYSNMSWGIVGQGVNQMGRVVC